MKRYSVQIQATAAEELIEIWEAISSKNPAAGDAYLFKLQKRIDGLMTMPERGAPREDLLPNLRMLVEGNYLIFYRVLTDTVELLHILHGSRDLTRYFN